MVTRDWPFVGRDDELRAIDDAAESGVVAVVVEGGVGMGKTRLAREAVARLAAAGRHAQWVVGTRSAASIPFGAVAHLLPPDAPHGGGPVELLRSVAARTAEWGRTQRVVIGVDDAHLLDDASAAVVGHLAARRLAFLLVTRRDTEPLPDAVSALVRDGDAAVLRLAGLAPAVVDELIDHSVGGPVEAASRRRLHRLAGGNPLLLGEALRSASPRMRYGVWRLEGMGRPSDRIAELVSDRLRGLDPGARQVLELVACGEPLGLAVLERLAGVSSTAAAEECGLVAIERDGMRVRVRLAHPLYGETVRAMMPASRTRQRLCQLAGTALDGPLRRHDDALRVALWQVDGGM